MLQMPTAAGIYATLGRWALYALVACGLLLAAYLQGVADTEKDHLKARLDDALAYADRIVELQDAGAQLAALNLDLETRQAPKDRLITKEITRYVEITPDADRRVLPGTFRVRHDAAATGIPLDTAGPVDDAAAHPIEDAAVLDTLGENYRSCREDQRKLSACHAHLDRLKREHEKAQ